MSVMIKDNTSAVLQALGVQIGECLEEIEPILLTTAQEDVPVKSGDLQRSIVTEIESDKLTLGSPLPYALDVEEEQPFLRPALHKNLRKIKKIFKAQT